MGLPKKENITLIEVKKHINAIHCSNNISLVQRKLFNAFLFHAYHDLPKKAQFEISVKRLCECIGYDSNDHKKLKNSIMALITTALEWNILDSDSMDATRWQASSIIASAKIEKGICTYEFSSLMRELLYRPEIYGRVDMTVMTRFKSNYGLALYENCIRFQGLSSTPWLTLSVFRRLMGIGEKNYSEFCDLKKRVLDIAIREVNQYSHLQVIPEIQRTNKKVTNIRFKLSLKSDEMIHVEHFENNTYQITKALTNDFGLSEAVVKDILSKYEGNYIQEKITLIQSSESYKVGRIRELAAYLIDAIKRDYKKGKSIQPSAQTSKNSQLEHDRLLKRSQDQQKKIYSKYLNEIIDQCVLSLHSQDKKKLYEKFEHDLSLNKYAYSQYKKHGLNNVAVKAIFNIFIKNNEISKDWRILSFDEYILNQTSAGIENH